MPAAHSIRSFDGAMAIITGGASGIGRALGEALVQRGAEVVLADLQSDLAEEVAAKLRAAGGKASAALLDVTDFGAMDRLVQETRNVRGRLDYFFNNAGTGVGGDVRYYEIKDWNRVFDVNLRGVANGVQAAYPVMIKQGFGHIVNTASMAGLMPSPLTVSYCATKYGVVGLSLSLRIEAAEYGVRVSVLCPGVIRTPILENCGKYGKMLRPLPVEVQRKNWERLRPMEPDRFARRVLSAVAKNKPIIVLPSWWKAFWWINRMSPALGLYVARKLFTWAQREWETSVASETGTPSEAQAARRT
jgi:NAD(P)-dependent dehydrogenase (short-subunit alcohol dehydrogenase family)